VGQNQFAGEHAEVAEAEEVSKTVSRPASINFSVTLLNQICQL
jgi:hypothetical protein